MGLLAAMPVRDLVQQVIDEYSHFAMILSLDSNRRNYLIDCDASTRQTRSYCSHSLLKSTFRIVSTLWKVPEAAIFVRRSMTKILLMVSIHSSDVVELSNDKYKIRMWKTLDDSMIHVDAEMWHQIVLQH